MTTITHGGAIALALSTLLAGSAQAAVILTGAGTHANNFDTLANIGQQNTEGLAGWEFKELGQSANAFYLATNGVENSGNTFSLGSAGSIDRALGTLVHVQGAQILQSLIGVQMVNNTGKIITGFEVSYAGEQWRLGQTNRGADRLDFSYRVGATQEALNVGSFTDVDALDFVAPNTTGAQVRNGNDAANRRIVTGSVSGLTVARGEVLTLRFSDFDIKGANVQFADDALGIDDFVFTPVLAAIPEPASWAMMIAGFGLAGAAMRRRPPAALA